MPVARAGAGAGGAGAGAGGGAGLAFTGSNASGWLVRIGVVLAAGGGVLLLISRRRHFESVGLTHRTPAPGVGSRPTRRRRQAGSVTKSISCSTAPMSGGSRSVHDVTRPSSCFQNCGGATADAERLEHAFLPRLTPRHVGPAVDAEHRRLHRLPDVDVGVAGDEHVGVVDRGRQARLLRAVDQVVEQHAEPPTGARAEGPHDLVEVVGTVEALDDDALDAQVVAPHLLDQLGIVDALDEQPAGPGDASRAVGNGDRPGGGPLRDGRLPGSAWLSARPA